MVPPRRTTRYMGRERGMRFGAAAVALLVALMLVAAGCGDDAGDSSGGAQASAGEPTYGKCKPTGKFNSIKIKTLEPDTLSVGYVTIAPATWRGDTEASVDDGFNYCFAANIAYRAGLSKIKLKKVDFAQLIVARESGFDIAMDDIYIRPEREEKIDFSIPYGASWSGLAGLAGDLPTQDDIKGRKFAVTLGSLQQKYLDETLKPTEKYNTYNDTVELFSALQAKQVNAVLIDMPVALPAAAKSNGKIKVVAQIKAGGEVGIVMPQGSPNKGAVDGVVQELHDSGELKNLEKKYYFDAYGGVDPESLPDWTSPG
jgi:polar amino acid transport system substrate-binding protein